MIAACQLLTGNLSCWCRFLCFCQWNMAFHIAQSIENKLYQTWMILDLLKNIKYITTLLDGCWCNTYFWLIEVLHSRFPLQKNICINIPHLILTCYGIIGKNEKETEMLTILSGCREPTYGCVTPQEAGVGNPPTSITRGTPWKKGSANTNHLEEIKHMMLTNKYCDQAQIEWNLE